MRTAPPEVGLKRVGNSVVWDMDGILEVDASFFYSSLLPPSPLSASRSVQDVVADLRSEGVIINDPDGENWRGCRQLPTATKIKCSLPSRPFNRPLG